MTLLAICQEVADVVGVQRPFTIVSAVGQLERQMLGFAKETLEELSLMDWPVLVRTANFNTVANVAQYDLPADFEHEIGDTLFSSTKYAQLRGSLSAGDWARQRIGFANLGLFKFRIFGFPLKLNITPTPSGVESVVYEYKTNSRTAALTPTYAADTDVPLVPEELVKKGIKWRLRRGKGLDYAEEYNDYEQARTARLAQQLQFASMPVAVRSPWGDSPITDGYVRENGFGV